VRVLFVTDQNITYDTGYRVRVESEVFAIRDQGVEVDLLAFLHARMFLSRVRSTVAFHSRLRGSGCFVIIIPVPPDFRIHWLVRIVAIYKRVLVGFFVKRLDPDVIHCHGTSATATTVASSALGTAPVLFDMHGAITEEIGYTMIGSQEKVAAARQRAEEAEKEAVYGADAIVSVSRALEDYWRSKYKGLKVASLVVPCAVDTARFFAEQNARASIRSECGLKATDLLFVYCGSTSAYQQLPQTLLVFARILEQLPSAWLLLLLSDFGERQSKRLVRENVAIAHRLILKRLERSKVPDWLSAADIGLLLRGDLLMNRVSYPTKFGEYLACGIPVVTTPYVLALENEIAQYGIGHVFDPLRSDGLDAVIGFATDVVANRAAVAEKCRAYVSQRLSWRRFGPQILHTYNDLQDRGARHSRASRHFV